MKTSPTDEMSDIETANGNYAQKYGFKDEVVAVHQTRKGLSKAVVEEISRIKKEPKWMCDFRLKSLEIFLQKPMPKWGADVSGIDFNNLTYYLKPAERQAKSWEDVPENIKRTFERLGIPEAEKKFLAGVGAQYESETVYHKIREDLEKQGVIFLDTGEALKEHEDIFRKFFSTVVPPGDNKFAALNSAVWSGGSFIYVPPGVKVEMPLQAYFRINAQNMGQFERTLIIADRNSSVHYIEGCFTKGAPVKTLNGTKKIEDVREGDFALTHTGSYKKVCKTQKRKHSGVLCTIKYFGDSRHKIVVTDGHPILAVKRSRQEYKNLKWNTEWVEAGNLKKGDYVAIPIDRTVIAKNERFFSVHMGRGRHPAKNIEFKITTDKDFFRLVGYYMAEGSIMNGHYLSFTFNKDEKEYIEDVKNLLEKFFGKYPLEYEEYKNGITLVLCSTLAARLFKQEFNSGAKNKSLPKWFLLDAPEKQAEFIKGYWRGDGNFLNKVYNSGAKTVFRINTISEILAEQTRDILLRLNIFASINVWKRCAPRSNSFAIYIGGSNLQIFGDIVRICAVKQSSGDLLLEHTVSYTKIGDSYAFVPVKSVKKEIVNDLDVYNFSVDDDESYVSHGIVVHNCSAPIYSTDSLHAAVVEIIAMENSRVKYTTIQNWSKNVYNLVTKRAHAHRNAIVEWIDGNIGSKVTMKYPCVHLLGEGAKAEIVSIAFAGANQIQDTGAKAIHSAPHTSSLITSKSISKDGGKTMFRGLVKVNKGALGTKAHMRCNALILDKNSVSDTIPALEVDESNVSVGHEAAVGKIGEDQLFYLMSRGLTEQEAASMIVNGFFEPFAKKLPLEYSVELNRLITLEMEN